MIDLAIIFLVFAIIAGVLGFADVKFISLEFARTLFVVFLIFLVISLVMKVVRGRRPPL